MTVIEVFGIKPPVALVSHSTLGSAPATPSIQKMKDYLDILIDFRRPIKGKV